MSLISLLVVLLLLGAVLYCIQLLPLPHPWKTIVLVLVVVIAVVYLLQALGALGGSGLHVGPLDAD